MKKQLLSFICLMVLTTSVLAQNPIKEKSVGGKQPSNGTNNSQIEINLRAKIDDLQNQLEKETIERKAAEDSLQKVKTTLNDVEKKHSEEMKKYSAFEKTILEMQKTHPILITRMDLGSFDEDCKQQYSRYGSELYSTKTKKLRLQIDYMSLLDKRQELSFKINLYYPEKTLIKKISVKKKGSTYHESIFINPGSGTAEFPCWQGQHDSYTFPDGEYIIEIYCDDILVGKKTFSIKNS